MIDLESHYSGKKVLLTGHTGFKGAWFTHWLHSIGASVFGCSLPAAENSLYRAINGDQYCNSEILDIRDATKLEALVVEVQPDYVFHFAAQSLVGESYAHPIETYATNTMGTVNLLHALSRLQHPCAVLIITTDKVYENNEWVYPYRETDRLGGHDPYSCSKACAEMITSSFRRSFYPLEKYSDHKIAIATARAGNVIGGGDWNKDHLVPDIVSAVSTGKPIALRSPNAIRPWQHVLEPLHGYLRLGAKLSENPLQYSGEWNFGPLTTETLSVQQFTEKAIKLWGNEELAITSQASTLHEANMLRLDSSKAESSLGWSQSLNVHQAIEWTLDWYHQHLAKPNTASDLVAENIARYKCLINSGC